MVVLSTLATAILFFLAGHLRLARVARYIPHPVVGGFLAGVGRLFIRGGVELMIGFWPTVERIYLLLEGYTLLQWLPGFLFGLILLLVARRWRSVLILPAVIPAGVLLFYAVLLFSGISIAEARASGWLFGSMGARRLWLPVSAQSFAAVRWELISPVLGKLGSLVLVSLLAVLLNISGIELFTGADLDPDRELRMLGGMGILVGALGGPAADDAPWCALWRDRTLSRRPALSLGNRNATECILRPFPGDLGATEARQPGARPILPGSPHSDSRPPSGGPQQGALDPDRLKSQGDQRRALPGRLLTPST